MKASQAEPGINYNSNDDEKGALLPELANRNDDGAGPDNAFEAVEFGGFRTVDWWI